VEWLRTEGGRQMVVRVGTSGSGLSPIRITALGSCRAWARAKEGGHDGRRHVRGQVKLSGQGFEGDGTMFYKDLHNRNECG
jgi:hypothetical protein